MKAIDCHATRDESADCCVVEQPSSPHSGGLNGDSAPNLINVDLATKSPLKLNGHHSDDSLQEIPLHSNPESVKVNGIITETSLVNGHGSHKIQNGSAANGHDIKLNGHINSAAVNGHHSPKLTNGFVEKKVVENGHALNGLGRNGEPKVNGVAVNGEPKVNGVAVNGVPATNGVAVNSEPKVNGVPATNGVSKNGEPKVNGVSVNGAAATAGDVEGGGTKDRAVAHLEDELSATRQELRLRDEEVARLSRIRTEVESELEDLTASLFQEAHNMVRQANVQQAQAERSLKESQMKVEVLQAEVAALKTLVLTSTPSRPNPHLHPQLQPDSAPGQATSGMNLFNRKHRRSPSHFNLKYGRENSPPDSPVKEIRGSPQHHPHQHDLQADLLARDDLEVDPVVHKEFLAWKQAPRLDRTEPFVARMYREDIELCLDFSNVELGTRVRAAIEAGTVFIEAVTEKSRTVFPKKCALMEAQRLCHYRMKLGDEEQWYHISQICRNRITAVCDFLNYLRYIERGLVKSSVHDVFWEIVRLRKEIVLARLGLPLS